MLDAPPIIVPAPIASGAPTKFFGDDETASLNYSEDPSAKDALIHIEDLSHRVSGLVLSGSDGHSHTGPCDSEEEETRSYLGHDASIAPTPTTGDALVRAISRKSHTFDGIRHFGLTFGHSNQSSNERRPASRGDRVLSGLRRSFSWLESPHVDPDALENRLIKAMKPSNLPRKEFIPQGQILKLVTQRSVERELSRWPRRFLQSWRRPASVPIERQTTPGELSLTYSKSENELSKHPRGRTYRKIFAILLLIGRSSKIWPFVEEGVCDADLPLVKVQWRDKCQDRWDLRCKRDSKAPLKCFKKWKRSRVAAFEEHQWDVLAPCFEKPDGDNVPHRELQPEEILPFTSWKKASEPGGFGQVYRVDIHPDHHSFDKIEVRTLL